MGHHLIGQQEPAATAAGIRMTIIKANETAGSKTQWWINIKPNFTEPQRTEFWMTELQTNFEHQNISYFVMKASLF